MRVRIAAAAAGVLLIAASVLAFSLTSHPAVAGTNDVNPTYQTLHLHIGTYCQPLPRLPAQTSRLQVRILKRDSPRRGFEILILDARGRELTDGRAYRVAPGTLTIGLHPLPPRRGAEHAWACFIMRKHGEIVFLGEVKRCVLRHTGFSLPAPCFRRTDKPADKRFRWMVGIRFLRSGSTSWLSQANLILDRFGLGQAGVFGVWAAWLAAVLAVLGVGLALWWLIREPWSNP